jgi:quinol monooxygenase YgiN
MPPITLHITWTLKPATTPSFLALVKPLISHVTKEPECHYFNVFRVSALGSKPEGEGDVMRLVEIWDPEGDQGVWLKEVGIPFYFIDSSLKR